MNRISLYILRHLTVATVIATAILAFAIWLTQSLRLIEVIVDGSAPFHIFLRMVLTTMPNFLTIVLPIGLVCAVLFTYNRFLADSEMVVMRAVGLSPMQLARPALILAFAVAGVGYAMNLYFLPLANQDYQRLRELVETEYSTVFLREGQFNDVGDGITVYFRERHRSGELVGILIHDNRLPDQPITMIAERGVIAQTESGPRVLMFNGNRQQADQTDGSLNVLYFEEYALDMEILKPEVGQRWRRPRERFLPDLLHPDLSDPQDRRFESRLISTGHQRLSSPLLSLAFTAIALATLLFGDFSRRGQGPRVAIALCGVVLLQACDFAMTTLTRRTLGFSVLLYAVPLTAFAAALLVMYLRPPRRWFRTAAPAP